MVEALLSYTVPAGVLATCAVLGGLFAVVAAAVIAKLRWRAPSSAGWLGLTATLLAAWIWLYFGDGVTGASEDTARYLIPAAANAAAQRAVLGLAQALVGLGFIGGAFTLGVVAYLSPADDAVTDGDTLKSVIVGSIVGLFPALAVLYPARANLLAAFVVLLLNLPLIVAALLASARVAPVDIDEHSRAAGQRGYLLVGGLVGLWLLGFGLANLGAPALVPGDLPAKTDAWAAAFAPLLSSATPFLLCLPVLTAPTALAGMLGLAPVFGRADWRVGLGAALGGTLVLVALATSIHGGWLADGRLLALLTSP